MPIAAVSGDERGGEDVVSAGALGDFHPKLEAREARRENGRVRGRDVCDSAKTVAVLRGMMCVHLEGVGCARLWSLSERLANRARARRSGRARCEIKGSEDRGCEADARGGVPKQEQRGV